MKNLAAVVLRLCWLAIAKAAVASELDGELRVYPSGSILSTAVDLPIDAHDWIALSIAYEFAERGSHGKHQDENGGGLGFGASYEHDFARYRRGWFVGGRFEIFQLGLDWSDPGRSGRSDVTVLQPTLRAGYGWRFDEGKYGLQLALSLGDEINVRTRCEDVGDGAILLGGAAFTFQP
jgi:hypothetical protein